MTRPRADLHGVDAVIDALLESEHPSIRYRVIDDPRCGPALELLAGKHGSRLSVLKAQPVSLPCQVRSRWLCER